MWIWGFLLSLIFYIIYLDLFLIRNLSTILKTKLKLHLNIKYVLFYKQTIFSHEFVYAGNKGNISRIIPHG